MYFDVGSINIELEFVAFVQSVRQLRFVIVLYPRRTLLIFINGKNVTYHYLQFFFLLLSTIA